MHRQEKTIKRFMDFLLNFIPFLKSYPVWVQWMVSIWIIGFAVIIVTLIVQKPKSPISASKEPTVNQEAAIKDSQTSNVYQAQRDLIINNPPQSTKTTKEQKEMEKPKKEDKPIFTIGNVSGDVVISQNQSGGITAHTVNVGPQARKLTKEQKITFVEYLKNNPKGDIIIEVKGPDKEPNDFANELEALLKESGWNITAHPISLVGNYNAKGMALLVHSKESAPPYIDYLYRAFENIGINIHAEIANSRPEGSLTLAIGYLPD